MVRWKSRLVTEAIGFERVGQPRSDQVDSPAGGGCGRLTTSSGLALLPLDQGFELTDQVLAGDDSSESAMRAGPSKRPITCPIKTSRLGSLVMSST